MADPATLAISIGANVVGGILGYKSAKSQASATSNEMLYKAGIADINSRIAKQNADYERTVGEREAQSYGMKARTQAGKIKVAQSASGLDINSGSNLQVQQGQQKITGMDMATIRANAARRAFGYETESFNQAESGKMLRTGASNVKKSGDIAAAASIIGSASSVAGKWMQAKQYGLLRDDSDSGTIGYFDNGGGSAPTWR